MRPHGWRWIFTRPSPPRDTISLAGLRHARSEDEMYGALVTIGGAFMRAGQGITTEVHDEDGRLAALIVPPAGPDLNREEL